MNTTGWLNGLRITGDGTGIVSHAGVALIRALADIEFIDDAPDGEQPRLGAWLELRADDPTVVLKAALDAGLTQVRHPGHPYYFMIPGGQVFTITPAG